MKRIISVILSMFFIANWLCSCENKSDNEPCESIESDVSVTAQEDYYDYYSHVWATSFYFFETDDGYYYLNSDNRLIYYSEKGKTNFVVLCNKPDCDHSTEDCNAYAGTYMGYYNGKIYGISYSYSSMSLELIRMNTDGTNHEKVADMPYAQATNGVGQRSRGGSVFFYKGYIINFINLTVEKGISYPVAYKVELETGKSTLLFDNEFSGCSGTASNFYPYGNTIWFLASTRNESYYCCLNLDTCEITGRFKPQDDMYDLCINDGLWLYYKKNIGFCEYNPETEEEKLLKQYDYTMANVVYGDEYIFAKVWKLKDDGKDRDSWMIMMDKSYNIIAQAELPTDAVTNMAFISVTSDFIFLYEGNEAPKGISHYIDLNKISDGKMTVEKIQ